jgi:hypothetical protein
VEQKPLPVQGEDRSYLLERKEQLEAHVRRVEAAINEALQREATRHEEIVNNMHRLRALRLERDQKREP